MAGNVWRNAINKCEGEQAGKGLGRSGKWELGMTRGLNRDFQDEKRMAGMAPGIILNIRFSSWPSGFELGFSGI
jgi:hypothetical protein